jgi:hypothetical protein
MKMAIQACEDLKSGLGDGRLTGNKYLKIFNSSQANPRI